MLFNRRWFCPCSILKRPLSDRSSSEIGLQGGSFFNGCTAVRLLLLLLLLLERFV